VRIVDVGLKGAFVPYLNVGYPFANGYHFKAKFVSRRARVVKKRKLSEVAGKVGSANTHAMSFDESFTGAGSFFVSDIDRADFFWIGEFDCVRHCEDR
jgi:hypothetical protein